jgi:hydroxyacylglutathione hydrolase
VFVDAWRGADRALATTPLLGPSDAGGRHVLDIRQASEFASGHVPGALHAELGTIASSTDGIPDTSMLVYCGHGERAMSAASLLQRAGHADVAVLAGGPDGLGALETGAGA